MPDCSPTLFCMCGEGFRWNSVLYSCCLSVFFISALWPQENLYGAMGFVINFNLDILFCKILKMCMIMTTVEHYMLFSGSFTNLHIVSGDHSLLSFFSQSHYVQLISTLIFMLQWPWRTDRQPTVTTTWAPPVLTSHLMPPTLRSHPQNVPSNTVPSSDRKYERKNQSLEWSSPLKKSPGPQKMDREKKKMTDLLLRYLWEKIHVISFVSHTPSKRHCSCWHTVFTHVLWQ